MKGKTGKTGAEVKIDFMRSDKLTKKEKQRLIKCAEGEIKEYQKFIKQLNN